MKRTTRYAIAGIGLALFGLAGCIGIILSPFESSHNVQSVQYTIKTEPIEESKFESIEPQYVYVEPQIVEQESEIEHYKSPINLTEDDRWFIESVVAGECAYEPYEGKLAVAQSYFDAMIKDGLSAREVKEVYQYAGWNPNLDKQDRKMYIEVMDAVHDIFDMGQFVTEKPILFFYAPSLCDSPWHESQNYAMTIGGHKFFYLTEDENAEWTKILLTKVNEYGIIEPQVMIMYVLYNNKYYLMQNAIKQFVPTPELSESFQFNDKVKAENALSNLPKQMRNLGYFVQQIDTPTKPVDFDQLNSELELVNYDSALAQIGSFCDLHDQLVARATWVEYKLQEVENKIQDVLHAIEFNSYNARDGYKIYKLLHDLRLERRKYKDEQIIADVMKSGFAGSNWELTRNRVDDLKDRQYHVREMEELFE